jgi:hypothetical protein
MPGSLGVMDINRDSAPNRPPRRGHALRWAAGVAAAAVLAGGGAALAAGAGPAGAASSGAAAADLAATSPASAGQAAALNAMLSSADSPTAADLAAVAPAASASGPAGAGPAGASPAGAGPAGASPAGAGPAGAGAGRPAHPCARAAAALRAAGHPKAATRAAAVCRGRLGRLRLLLRGEHGQVTYKAQDGTAKTLAFERGKITAISGTAVTVTAADGTTSTWHLVGDSVIRQQGQKASAASLAVGQPVFAGGPVVSGSDDARLIVIRPAVPASSASAAPSSSAAPSGS